MADSFAIYALRRKRARLAGAIAKAQNDINRQRDALATLDAVIRMFEPASNPQLIPAIRPVSQKNLYFQRGEQMRLCLSALREAGKPTSARWVAEYAMAAKGLDPEPRVRDQIIEHIRSALGRLETRGIARKIVQYPDTWWELTQ